TDKLDELMAWLLRVGHPYSGRPFAIYYDDPAEVEEEDLRAEVCLPINEECEPEGEVERKTVEGGDFASVIHEGSYAGLDDAYDEIFDWLEENGYQMDEEMGTREVFEVLMGEVDSIEEVRTDVLVPVASVGVAAEEDAAVVEDVEEDIEEDVEESEEDEKKDE
ncbi:MAG: AraC family transcriptional regulator, partial [Planctomycetota bacterium]